MMNKINCKGLYSEVIKEVVQDIREYNIRPCYTCYIIKGEDGKVDTASDIYTSLKHKTSEEAGVICNIIKLTEDEFLDEMRNAYRYNARRSILQLPCPQSCIEAYATAVEDEYIIDVDHLTDDVYKDIGGTPRGIIALLSEELGSISGKKVAIVGARSKTTGKYLVQILTHLGATVVSYTSRSIIKQFEFADCDAVVSCVGKPKLIDATHLGANKPVLIDVGVSIVDGKIIGDFDLSVRGIARYTPYVSGVGLITRGFLVRSVVDSYIIDGGRY